MFVLCLQNTYIIYHLTNLLHLNRYTPDYGLERRVFKHESTKA